MLCHGQLRMSVATNQASYCCLHVGAKKEKQMQHLNGQEQVNNSSCFLPDYMQYCPLLAFPLRTADEKTLKRAKREIK